MTLSRLCSRLAHAHEHERAQAAAGSGGGLAEVEELLDDLAGVEVQLEAAAGARAESRSPWRSRSAEETQPAAQRGR